MTLNYKTTERFDFKQTLFYIVSSIIKRKFSVNYKGNYFLKCFLDEFSLSPLEEREGAYQAEFFRLDMYHNLAVISSDFFFVNASLLWFPDESWELIDKLVELVKISQEDFKDGKLST